MRLGWLFATALLLVELGAPVRKPSLGYDPKRDPARDLEVLVAQAQHENRRIILVIGGEWCGWCHVLNSFIAQDADLRELWSRNFLTLKVNFSHENENNDFLGRYPAIEGYPHLFVLEKDGRLLHSQRTDELESGRSYSRTKMEEFLLRWASPEASQP